MFTQPKMYEAIGRHRPTVDIYREKLLAEQISSEDLDAMNTSILDEFETSFVNAPSFVDEEADWLESRWAGFKKMQEEGFQELTAVDEALLKKVGLCTTVVPPGFQLHKALQRIMKARAATVETGTGIDFATAEAMAFGTLMCDGVHVRMSGQDVGRGTFSHRHAVLHDQNTEETHTPLQHIQPEQAQFTIENSHLSEYAVLGFELGYSMNSPQQLVLWEAQFGDFANTAQCIIDQFISSGEQKWKRQSGLVLLLPHGYEGMGPEHSSARLERFLQMSADDPYTFPQIVPGSGKQIQSCNWQVSRIALVNPWLNHARLMLMIT
jgi:2-oxoglutarate dehydrogenase E1 component